MKTARFHTILFKLVLYQLPYLSAGGAGKRLRIIFISSPGSITDTLLLLNKIESSALPARLLITHSLSNTLKLLCMEMHQSRDNKVIPMTSISSGKLREARS